MYQSSEIKSVFSFLMLLLGATLLLYVTYKLSDILRPFLVGLVLAYFLNPLVTRLTRRLRSRGLASLMVVLGVILATLLFMAFLVPVLIHQIRELIDKMPLVLNWLDGLKLPDILKNELTLREFFSIENLQQIWQSNSETIKTLVFKASNYAKETGSSIIFLIYNLLMLPITLFYFLYDWPQLLNKVSQLVPPRYYSGVRAFMQELDVTLSGFIRGQFVVMLVMGLIYGTGLLLAGLENGFAIGFMMGFLVFIPYFGFILGSVLATLAAILQYGDMLHIGGVWLVFIIGQVLESFLITPKLVGDRIGLSPFTVVFALFAFGKLFGFMGMLMALPLSAVCLVTVRTLMHYYYSSNFYLKN